MPLEHIFFASVIGIVALLIVLLNDKSKPKEVVKKQQSNWNISPLGIVVSIIVFVGAIASGLLFANDNSYLAWAIMIGLFLIPILLLAVPAFWKIIRTYISAIFSGGLIPQFVISDKEGNINIKCPCCKKKIAIKPENEGESSFQCENCGEIFTWTPQK